MDDATPATGHDLVESSHELSATSDEDARVRRHLRQHMADRGITREDLARCLGSNDEIMRRILAGTLRVGIGLLLRICRALNITPTCLLEEDPPERFSDEAQDADE
jgi:transcriptional regulator with XRE-family HTH domain